MGNFFIPDMKLFDNLEVPICKYGCMRQRYLKEHWTDLYRSVILNEKMYPYLLEINQAARERLDTILSHRVSLRDEKSMILCMDKVDEYAENSGGENHTG